MSKIHFKATINNGKDNITTEGIGNYKEKNLLINYKEEDNTSVLLNLSEKKLIRENDEMLLEIDFCNNNNSIYVKEFSKKIYLDISNVTTIIKENSFNLGYELENNKYTYKIEWKNEGDEDEFY